MRRVRLTVGMLGVLSSACLFDANNIDGRACEADADCPVDGFVCDAVLATCVPEGVASAGGTEGGSGDVGDTVGDGDGDSAGDGTSGDGTTGDGTMGDGDGDGTTGDGDGDGTTGDGDGDGATGDGDGDGTTGDGDGTTGDGDGTTGDGTAGDGTTGDGDGTSAGDGDGTSGDGDGDGTSAGDGDGTAGDGDGTTGGDGDGTTAGDGDGDGTTAGDGDGDGTTGGGCSSNADCDDGLACNGLEFCDATDVCQAGPPACTSVVACAIVSCVEDPGGPICNYDPDDSQCDNGMICDGAETCDPAVGCLSGTPLDCTNTDAVDCTLDQCDESLGCTAVENSMVCPNGTVCDLTAGCVNAGTTQFELVTTFGAMVQPRDFAVGDVDGDGNVDVVLADSSSIDVYLGDGMGGFGFDHTEVTLTGGQAQVALGDYTLDGRLDLVYHDGSQTRGAPGLGNGAFDAAAGTLFPGSGSAVAEIIIDEVTDNGWPDVVVVYLGAGAEDATLYRDPGTGSLSESLVGPLTPSRAGVTVDANRDGGVDLVIDEYQNGALAAFSNPIGSSWQPLSFGLPSVRNIVALHADDDGYPDIAVTTDSPNLGVAHGQSDGTFSTATLSISEPTYGIAAADFDADSHDDLLISSIANNTIGLHLGDGATGFTEVGSWTSDAPFDVVVADVDNDSYPDALVRVNAGIEVWLNRQPVLATPSMPTSGAPAILGSPAIALGATDWNVDGELDAVVGSDDGTITIAYGDGTGELSTLQTSGALNPDATDLLLADIDDDGDNDAVLVAPGSISTQINDRPAFGSISLMLLTSGTTFAVADAADLEPDGDVDLVVASAGGGQGAVEALINDGTGGFSPTLVFSGEYTAVAVGDIDRDVDVDIVAVETTATPPILDVFINDSGGWNLQPSGTQLTDGVEDIALADINRDGWPDVVTTDPSSGMLMLYVGDGAGGFSVAMARSIPGPTSATTLAIEDLDRDGWLDIIVGTDSDLYFVKNSYGVPAPTFTVMQSTEASHLMVLGQFEETGRVDAVASDAAGAAIRVFKHG